MKFVSAIMLAKKGDKMAKIVRCWGMPALLGACLLATGCMVAPVIPPLGAAYADISAPLEEQGGVEEPLPRANRLAH